MQHFYGDTSKLNANYSLYEPQAYTALLPAPTGMGALAHRYDSVALLNRQWSYPPVQGVPSSELAVIDDGAADILPVKDEPKGTFWMDVNTSMNQVPPWAWVVGGVALLGSAYWVHRSKKKGR